MEVFVQKNYIKISLGISVLLFLICSKVLFKTKKSNLPHPPAAAPLSFTHHPRRFPHIFPTTHKTNFPQTPPRNSLTHRPRSFPRISPTKTKSDLPYFHRRAGSYSQADRTAKVRQIRFVKFYITSVQRLVFRPTLSFPSNA